MNYTTITINGEKIGLKFGMASFRYLSEGRLTEGKSFRNNELTEIGIAHILYSGYYNNCIVKDVEANLTFEDFVDFVELNLTKNEFINELKEVIEVWSKCDIIKQTQTEEEPKKKNSRGKK